MVEDDIFQLPLEMCPAWGTQARVGQVALHRDEAVQLGYPLGVTHSVPGDKDEHSVDVDEPHQPAAVSPLT